MDGAGGTERWTARRRLAALVTAAVAAVATTGMQATASGATWTILKSPNTSAVLYNEPLAISCAGSGFCMAVGYTFDSSTNAYHTLTDRWTGSTWSIVASPDPQTDGPLVLYGVSCVSSAFCVATGFYTSATGYRPLIEKWNGTSWAVVTAPGKGFLYKVSCTSTTFCVAVGQDSTTLIEMWNGSTWRVVPSPNPGYYASLLWGVSCASATFCMAVDSLQTETTAYQTLIERWNGSTWKTVASPNPAGTFARLFGVSCPSTTFCAAVGQQSVNALSTVYEPLAERWNGSTWQIATTPQPAGLGNAPWDVSCASARFCVMVGQTSTVDTGRQPFVEEWRGAGWSAVTVPMPGNTSRAELWGISCLKTAQCFAAGYYYPGKNHTGGSTTVPSRTFMELRTP